MGMLFTGPMGAGKTFVAEAFAKECGLTTIKLKNFRSKWVGATEGNLERSCSVVQAIGQVVVIIDEGDRAFGNQPTATATAAPRRASSRASRSSCPTPQPRAHPVHPDDEPPRQAGRRHQARRPPRPQDPVPLRADARGGRGGGRRAQVRKNHLDSTASTSATTATAVVREARRATRNADVEAVILLATDDAAGSADGARAGVGARTMVQAIADYLPSRDVKMLEYMELLAVFEASNRKMLPKKYETMSAEELQARLDLLRLECGNRR